jgi:hypothetical protein
VGVERFYLYDNRSVDHHREVLAPYLEEGIVDLTDWPVLPPAQVHAYEDCLKRHRDEARWIAFIDLDEFLFSPTGRPVADVLSGFERWPGVGVNWAVFGSTGHRTKPPGLVTESYIRRTAEHGFNRHIKSVVDPTCVRAFCMPTCFMYGDGLAVDEKERPIEGPPYGVTDSVSFSTLRINHYATKSEEEYRRKLRRGRADTFEPKGLTERGIARRLRMLDQVEDTTIHMYLPALRRALEHGRTARPTTT